MSQSPAGQECDPRIVLQAWERATGVSAARRGEALLQAADLPLGQQHARLAALHTRLFGREMTLVSQCPGCGALAEFIGDSEAIAAPAWESLQVHRLETFGHAITFRLPTTNDLAALSHTREPDEFAHRLLERCVLESVRSGVNVPAGELPDEVSEALSLRMHTLDPAASVSFALECPDCHAVWDAPLDLGEVVWQKIQAAAEALLTDIDALARAYGWTEDDVLALSPLRRAAYLQLVQA